jgi:hypothetical protein
MAARLGDVQLIVAQLAKLKENGSGLTSREIAKEAGRVHTWANALLKEAFEQGLCECAGKRYIKKIDGSAGYIPVYRFLTPKKT